MSPDLLITEGEKKKRNKNQGKIIILEKASKILVKIMESTHFLVSTPYFWCHLTLLLGEDKDNGN